MSEITAPRPVSFASLVQRFFTEYLVKQRAVSPRTIASYRDAMMLFLDFAHERLGKSPTTLSTSFHKFTHVFFKPRASDAEFRHSVNAYVRSGRSGQRE